MDCQQIVKSIGWLGESWGFWIQTGAFFLSALGAIAVIYYNGKQARLRALIDLIVHQKTDKDLADATRLVNSLHQNGQSWTAHLDPDCDERKAILKILNNQEFISVGIRMKAFDESVYKEMQCTNVLRLWDASGNAVQNFWSFFRNLKTNFERKEKTLIAQRPERKKPLAL